MVGFEGDRAQPSKPYYRYARGDIAEIFSRKTGVDFYETFQQHGHAVVDAVKDEPDLRSKVLHHTLAAFNAGKNGNKAPTTPRHMDTATALGKLLGEDGRAVADYYFTEAYEAGQVRRQTPSSGAQR